MSRVKQVWISGIIVVKVVLLPLNCLLLYLTLVTPKKNRLKSLYLSRLDSAKNVLAASDRSGYYFNLKTTKSTDHTDRIKALTVLFNTTR